MIACWIFKSLEEEELKWCSYQVLNEIPAPKFQPQISTEKLQRPDSSHQMHRIHWPLCEGMEFISKCLQIHFFNNRGWILQQGVFIHPIKIQNVYENLKSIYVFILRNVFKESGNQNADLCLPESNGCYILVGNNGIIQKIPSFQW